LRWFAMDSLLEEGVTSEPVSEDPEFPASTELTGNFIRIGRPWASNAGKNPAIGMS
jgi:hypothetical protein